VAVARIESAALISTAIVRAEGVGEAQIYAKNAQTPSGPVSLPLAYCAEHVSCEPVEILLRVVP
jgi:hypothetical protein